METEHWHWDNNRLSLASPYGPMDSAPTDERQNRRKFLPFLLWIHIIRPRLCFAHIHVHDHVPDAVSLFRTLTSFFGHLPVKGNELGAVDDKDTNENASRNSTIPFTMSPDRKSEEGVEVDSAGEKNPKNTNGEASRTSCPENVEEALFLPLFWQEGRVS
ncbi:uncharacterized protein LOC112494761 [Cephus cinctus]|uniref:Uncharacterized protein LOC112494761 n=1 Tax=Cephus cinctus TaxID=211228 RepID=A0AAJ7W3U5_CEPCN|nr:uncharacterized protein LOC112494761 [Cephus cinctus]